MQKFCGKLPVTVLVCCMAARAGHDILRVPNVAGGMCAIQFHDNGLMDGAGGWRADGTAIGLGGGHARPGVRFRPEAQRA